MAEGGSSNVMTLVAMFIAIAIVLGIGVQILGNSSFDCVGLPGNATAGNLTEWQATCDGANADTRTAYNLLLVSLIVVAAVAILFIVRML